MVRFGRPTPRKSLRNSVYVVPWINKNERNYISVGNLRSVGKRRLPAAFGLEEVVLHIPGTIDSNQLAEGPAPLLLSSTMQAILSFLHNKREGTVQLVDYDYARVKCYS